MSSRKLLLVLTLFLTFAFAVAGLGVLINALVQSHKQVSSVRRLLPSGTTISIDSSGLLNPGKVSTSIHVLLVVLSILSLLALYVPRYSSPRSLLVLALSLGLASVWLLATTIAFTVVYATDASHVSAWVGGVPIPDTIISDQARALGLSTLYKNQWYLRIATIIPWFTWLFSALACTFMMLAWMSASQYGVGEHGVTTKNVVNLKGEEKDEERSPI